VSVNQPIQDQPPETSAFLGAALNDGRGRRLAAPHTIHDELTTVLESITDAFFSLDLQWRFTYVNRAAERILGRPRDDLLCQVIWDVVPLATDPVHRREYERAQRDQAPLHFEQYYTPFARWFEVHAYPSPAGLSVYFTDVTDRKRSLAELRDSQERLLLATEGAELGTWDWNLVSGRLDCDARCKAMLGLAPDTEVTYDAFIGSIHPDDRRGVEEAVTRALAAVADYQADFRCRWPDGAVRWIHERGSVIRNAAGEPDRMVGIALDITQGREAEESIRRLNADLERRVAERTEVAEQRAAQLQALAFELTQAEQRERRRLAQLLHDHLQQLLVGAKFNINVLRGRTRSKPIVQMAGLVSDLLDEAVKASRSLTVELSPPILYDGGLVAALGWLGRQLHEKQGLTVRVETDGAIEPEADEIRVFLFQAVRELLLNVVKHAGVHEASVRLAPLGSDKVQVIVTDSGAGFDSREIDRNMSASAGFGLMSIRERLSLLGGEMIVASATGQGSRFTLVAPVRMSARSSRPAQGQSAEPPLVKGAVRAVPQGVLFKGSGKIRVLLADDHPIVRQGLARLLTEEPDMEVVAEAADGRTAIELARQVQPDVVIMDVTMPGGGGIQATRVITGEFPAMRVIGLSMHAEADMAAAMRRAGAADYLAKGGSTETLVAAIRRNGRPE
jgi:PAS domain S-box-containing protein